MYFHIFLTIEHFLRLLLMLLLLLLLLFLLFSKTKFSNLFVNLKMGDYD